MISRRAKSLLLLTLLVGGQAEGAEPGWLGSRVNLELQGGVGWRVALGEDTNASGFHAVTLGGQLVLGIEIAAGWAIVASGRARYGTSGEERYAEATGALGVQLSLNERLRARVGGDGGNAWLLDSNRSSGIAGGWIEVSVDVLNLGLRGSITLGLRFEMAAFLSPLDGAFPSGTVALAAALGARY